MTNDFSAIESQLYRRLRELRRQLGRDADQLRAAIDRPGKLDVTEMRRGHSAAQNLAEALQALGDFEENRQS